MPPLVPLSAARAAWVRALVRERKAREAEQLLVLEGEKPLGELLARDPGSVAAVVLTRSAADALMDRAGANTVWSRVVRDGSVPLYECRDTVFGKFSDLVTAAGVLGVVRRPPWKEADVSRRAHLLAVYGEGIQDPANVGAIVRTAAAFGVDACWFSPDSADAYGPKAVRAAAGGILLMPVFAAADLSVIQRLGCRLFAAERPGPGSRPIDHVKEFPAKAMLAFGNESRGLSPELLQAADVRFHIPLRGQVESLNVAAAAAVSVFHFTHLRGSARTRL
jgi:TrmH family RNA methyltransferase